MNSVSRCIYLDYFYWVSDVLFTWRIGLPLTLRDQHRTKWKVNVQLYPGATRVGLESQVRLSYSSRLLHQSCAILNIMLSFPFNKVQMFGVYQRDIHKLWLNVYWTYPRKVWAFCIYLFNEKTAQAKENPVQCGDFGFLILKYRHCAKLFWRSFSVLTLCVLWIYDFLSCRTPSY